MVNLDESDSFAVAPNVEVGEQRWYSCGKRKTRGRTLLLRASGVVYDFGKTTSLTGSEPSSWGEEKERRMLERMLMIKKE